MHEQEEFFKKSNKNPEIFPFELNKEGSKGQALVLRYAGCNLRCPLCYAWKYAWFPQKESRIIKISKVLANIDKIPVALENDKINWIRIQGGEPCLHFDRTLFTIKVCYKALQIVYELGLNAYGNTRAIIQTNGMYFSTLTDKQSQIIYRELEKVLGSLSRGKIVFEFSFKDPSGRRLWNNDSLLKVQINGFRKMLNRIVKPLWNNGFENIALYPVAGLGPSIDLHDTTIIPIDPYSLPNEYPLFHPKTWAYEFKSFYNEFVNNMLSLYKTYRDFYINHGRKMPLEELEPAIFQRAWISGYAGEYQKHELRIGRDLPKLSDVLRRSSRNLGRWVRLCKQKGKLKERWLDILRQIPIAQNPNKLLDLVKNMNKKFYSSHPKNHYPFL